MTTWVKQAPGTKTCGQIAIAALAEVSLEQVVEVVGHDHATVTRELARALRKFGLRPLGDFCRWRKRPDFGLAQMRSPRFWSWHWVAVDGALIYDGVFADGPVGVPDWPRRGRLTSFLPVVRP